MEIQFITVLLLAIFSMALGAVWYGPLFGKAWMHIIGATELDMQRRKEMQRRAMPLYGVQFILTFLQVYILAHFIKGWENATGIETALWLFAGFIIPTLAAGAMWNNDSAKVSWARFLIQSGYQLILFIVFGVVLSLFG